GRNPKRQEPFFGSTELGSRFDQFVLSLLEVLQRQGLILVQILGQFLRPHGILQVGVLLHVLRISLGYIRTVHNEHDIPHLHPVAKLGPHFDDTTLHRRRNARIAILAVRDFSRQRQVVLTGTHLHHAAFHPRTRLVRRPP